MHWSAKVIKANHTEIMLVFITVYIKDVVHLTLSDNVHIKTPLAVVVVLCAFHEATLLL